MNDFVQVVHLLVSLLLVLSLVAPYLPASVRSSKLFKRVAFAGPEAASRPKDDLKPEKKSPKPQLSALKEQILASYVVGVLRSAQHYIVRRVGLRPRDDDSLVWLKVAESFILSGTHFFLSS